MSACQSCGGIIGRDCWNPQECAEITSSMASQSQACEEAQPVAWLVTNKETGHEHLLWQPLADLTFNRERFSTAPLYTTPPAPEAEKLRVAVEALERIKSRKQTCASDEVEAWELQDIATQALAALQQEA